MEMRDSKSNIQPAAENSYKLLQYYCRVGLDYFDDTHVLELLLQYGTTPQESRTLSRQLIQKFGGIRQVLEAPMEDLEYASGIDMRLAALISLPAAMYRFSQQKSASIRRKFSTISECGEYFTKCFIGYRNEVLLLLCLDSQSALISCQKITEGSFDKTDVPFRRIIEVALCLNAASVILAHNHPGGALCFSPDDICTTIKLSVALKGIDVLLEDHIVVVDNQFVSMRQQRLYEPDKNNFIYI